MTHRSPRPGITHRARLLLGGLFNRHSTFKAAQRALTQLGRGALLATALASNGCGSEAPSTFSGEAETVEQELSANETCDTRPADLVWNGGGAIRTSATYAAHEGTNQCASAFLIDLNNYDAKYTKGTHITYGRVIPTNEPDCIRAQIRAYVWRKNSNGTTTYLGNALGRGKWVTDPLAGSRCMVPSVALEDHLPGFTPGGSYRLALSARFDNTTGFSKREIVAATEKPTFLRTALRQQQDMTIMWQELSGISGVNIEPRVQAYFGKRGTTAAAMECRVMQIELSAMRIMQRSLEQAGAAAATAQRRSDAFNSLYQGYCVGTSPGMLTLQGRLRDYFRAVLDVHFEIALALGVQDGKAAEVMAAINLFDMGRIMAGCGADPGEFSAFVRTGATPAGMTGPNVLLRNCTSDVNATQSRLGMTGSNTTIRNALKSCIVQAFDAPPIEQQDSICSDPRANGGSECIGNCHDQNQTAACDANPASTACLEELRENTGFGDLGDSELQADMVQSWLTAGAYYEAVNNFSMTNDQIKELVIRDARNGVLQAQEQLRAFDASLSDAITTDANGRVTYNGGSSRHIERNAKVIAVTRAQDNLERVLLEQNVLPAAEEAVNEERRKLCAKDPNHAECQPPNGADPAKLCPQNELEGGPVWFDHMDGSPMSVADRIATCTCEAMRRVTFTTSGGQASQWFCMTAEEKQRFDCQTNPWGPNDGLPNPLLRPECKNAFQPSGLDRDALHTDLCDTVRCGEDQTGVVINGRCTCFTDPPATTLATACNFNGPAGSLDCEEGDNLVCDLEGARCVDPNNGRTPFGNNPLCRIAGRVTQLGGAPAWGRENANDFFAAAIPVASQTRDAFMMKQGFRFIAGPENFKRAYDEVGTSLVAEMFQPSQLPADRGDLQAYCSNPGAGVNNIFLGQRGLAAGTNQATFTIDPSCWGDGTTAARFGFGVRTASNQAQRGGFLGYRLAGTFTRTPNPFQVCDDGPDPGPQFLDPNLLNELRGGLIFRGLIDGTWLTDIRLGDVARRAPTVPLLTFIP